MRNRGASARQGFTLLEVIVAISIFAIMSTMAFWGLDVTIEASQITQDKQAKLNGLITFFNRLERDINSMAPEPVRNADGVPMPPLIGFGSELGSAEVNFTRIRSRYQNGSVSVLRRVGYRYNDGGIEIVIWPFADMSAGNDAGIYTVLEGVKSFAVNYYARDQWFDSWSGPALPRGLEAVVTLDTGERVSRLFALGL